MRFLAFSSLCLLVFQGFLAAQEPLPLPTAEEDTLPVMSTTPEPLYQELTCCPEAVAECTANDCCHSTCDGSHHCDSCRNGGHCDDCDSDGCCLCRLFRNCCCCENHCFQMLPHLPYRPAATGDYYFRPYNFTQIPTERALGPRLGETFETPYAATSFEVMYLRFEANYDASNPMELEESPKLFGEELPDLEATLEQ